MSIDLPPPIPPQPRPPDTGPPVPDALLAAANQFREQLVPSADGKEGSHPWWHGWAIIKAFEAGAAWQKLWGKP